MVGKTAQDYLPAVVDPGMVGKTAQDYLPAVGDPGMVGKTAPRITSLRSVILEWSAKQPPGLPPYGR